MWFIGSHIWCIGQLNYVIWPRVQINNEFNIGSVTVQTCRTLTHLWLITQTCLLLHRLIQYPTVLDFNPSDEFPSTFLEYGINRCLQLSWWTGLPVVSSVGCLAGLIWSGTHSSWCALYWTFFPICTRCQGDLIDAIDDPQDGWQFGESTKTGRLEIGVLVI